MIHARVVEVVPGTAQFEAVLSLADEILDQRRHIISVMANASEDHVLGAFHGERCVGFLRFYVTVIGSEEGRPAVTHAGSPLTEGFVEALGVHPEARRTGVGSALQRRAQELCRAVGCYQIRSRSPVSSVENYAMKLAEGYVLDPSTENDSYYFLKKLSRHTAVLRADTGQGSMRVESTEQGAGRSWLSDPHLATGRSDGLNRPGDRGGLPSCPH